MRVLSVFSAVLALGLAWVPAAEAAEFDVGVRLGNSKVRIGNDGVRARINLGTGPYRRGLNRRYDRRSYPHDTYDPHRRLIFVPLRERTIIRRETPPPQPNPIPRRPEPEPQPVVTEPLDPSGGARIVAARGQTPAAREYVLGEVLPPDLPHVTLDHRRYGLPEPPAGQIYARVGRDVLRIDPATRRIIAVVAN